MKGNSWTLLLAPLLILSFRVSAADIGEKTDSIVEATSSNSTVGGAASRLAIEAGSDKTTASAKIGKSWSSDGINAYKWAISAKTPFDSSKQDSVDLGTLSGLTAGTSAQIQGGWFHWTRADAKTMDDVCRQAIEALFPRSGYSWWSPGLPDDKFKYFNAGGKDNALGTTDCEALLSSPDALQRAVYARIGATKDTYTRGDPVAPAADPKMPVDPDLSRIQALYLKQFREAKNPVSNAEGITLAATGNRQKFSFANSSSNPTAITSANKEGYGASIAGTLVRSWYVLGAGYQWEKSFKGGKEVQICTPIGTSTSSACANGALSRPSGKNTQILFVEGRAIVYSLAGIGVSPRVEYSINDSKFGFQLPIFLAANKDRILDGGIAVGWTEDDHWGASIFVGKTFSFF